MPQMFCMPTLKLRHSLYALHEKDQTSSEKGTVNNVPVKGPLERLRKITAQRPNMEKSWLL
jgi:hypothetical protein